MYCKHCGKEIANDSKFCQYCGERLDIEWNKNMRNMTLFFNKKYVLIYIIWLAVNITALVYALANPHCYYTTSQGEGFDIVRIPHKDTSSFFPFESYNIGNYDFSEFVVYTVAIPLCLYAIGKLIISFKRNK